MDVGRLLSPRCPGRDDRAHRTRLVHDRVRDHGAAPWAHGNAANQRPRRRRRRARLGHAGRLARRGLGGLPAKFLSQNGYEYVYT